MHFKLTRRDAGQVKLESLAIFQHLALTHPAR